MKTALLLLAYGTPETPEFVVPYYTHIRGGRPPSPEKADELRHRYEAVGGRTPLTRLTNEVRDAVAAGLAPFALGSDTGGSIRLPAAANGLAGLKATYGGVSRSGVLPNCWSLDVTGALCRTAEDSALVLGCGQ